VSSLHRFCCCKIDHCVCCMTDVEAAYYLKSVYVPKVSSLRRFCCCKIEHCVCCMTGVEAAFYLESVNCMRKYLGMLDLPLALFLEENVYVLSPSNILRAQVSCCLLTSQNVPIEKGYSQHKQ
jgi:hypothetical protein